MDMPLALSDQKQPSSVLAIQATVLVFNLVSSIAIITVNKYTFSYFPYPAALTCVHYAFSLARYQAAAVLRCV